MPFVRRTYLNQRARPTAKVVALVAVSLLGIASTIYWRWGTPGSPFGPAQGKAIFEAGEFTRLLTAIFLHADFTHLVSNSVSFGILTYLVFGYFGWGTTLFGILFGGALTNFFAIQTYPPQVYLLGASGVVYLLAGFWLTLVLLIDRRFGFGMRLLRVVGFFLVLLFPTTFNPTTSYRTHAIGFALGVGWAVIFFIAKRRTFRAAEIVYEDEPEAAIQITGFGGKDSSELPN